MTNRNQKSRAFICPIVFGVVLILVGILLRTPGTVLTTYEILDGDTVDSSYYIGSRYAAIDEYVGGDAYNYIIGASLIAGRISGMIVAKTICIVVGAVCICFGVTLEILSSEKNKVLIAQQAGEATAEENEPAQLPGSGQEIGEDQEADETESNEDPPIIEV